MFELLGWLALALLGLKVLWNLVIPYILAKDIIVGGNEESRKISLFLMMEWIFVAYLLLSSTPYMVISRIGSYQKFAICVVSIVLISYIHFFVVGIVSVGFRKIYDNIKTRAR
jgi:hypothetical protein